MLDRRFVVTLLSMIGCVVFLGIGQPPASAQQASGTRPDAADVIHVETRLVLVDAVVTDKKGYVRDLTQKDFHVWEDGKEQTLTSFSLEESSAANPQPRYLVLFFDNSTMDMGDQIKARDAAAKFIDANAGSDRLMAVADFGGSVRISQNFTTDARRLKQVVMGPRNSAVSPNGPAPVMVASLGSAPPELRNAEAEFGVHSVLLALRSLAKGLSTVPGRKTVVLLTAGFPMNFEYESEVTAVIDTCNKYNVAVYPIDVRGLTVPDLPSQQNRLAPPSVLPQAPTFVLAAFRPPSAPSQPPVFGLEMGLGLGLAPFSGSGALSAQRGGPVGGGGHGGGGGGGHGGGGGTGGGHAGGGFGGSAPGMTSQPQPRPPSRDIVPQFPPSASDNQQVMYQLADGTGGFVILNTNALLNGLQRIANDQNQYYLLGYKPPVSTEGRCHSLKVKVDRGGTAIRSRSGYCDSKSMDLLAGNAIEKDLESRAQSEAKGNVTATMQAPFFYTSPNTAQVHLAVEIPSAALKFEKTSGKQHAVLNILGLVYKPDGSVAARFTDATSLDFEDEKGVQEFQKQPFHYENQFGIAAGTYQLKVVFSSGTGTGSYGELKLPLVIDPYRGQELSISGVALSNDIRPVGEIATDLDDQLLDDKTPLLVVGLRVTPSATNHFKKTDQVGIYAEVYEPLLKSPNPPEVAYELIIVERKTGAEKFHVGDRTPKGKPGDMVIPLGLKVPVAPLEPGEYQVQLRAVDSVGNESKTRLVDFAVE
jgi:VWFA-related protein